ncbi:MAG: lysine-2,3-aminomutase-like protein [Beijerinckiaceae bacterium]|nr:lysine-2,3-aminomutase-like protein [Beijerinckiaceae bacterium]
MKTLVADLASPTASASGRARPGGSLRSAADLAAAGLVSPARAAALAAVEARYSVALTAQVASMIDPADPRDPIALQFVPDAAELTALPQERADPIGDDAHAPLEGIVHRYPDRVLIKLLHACAVYCRFCFRRETVGPGGASSLSPQAFAAAMDYIAARPQIWEVILTGGDPLTISPRRMAQTMGALATISHVKIVRIHTRIPVVNPARIDDEMIAALKASGKTVYVALHANHPRELNAAARAACARIIDAGMPMVSQTVLLRGVNDDPAILSDLMRAFVENRIKPYYLHHPDLAPGTSHLRVTLERGREIAAALRGHLSGLCQPEYVLDIPGGYGKVPVGPAYAQPDGAGEWRVTDYRGGRHAYADPPAPDA